MRRSTLSFVLALAVGGPAGAMPRPGSAPSVADAAAAPALLVAKRGKKRSSSKSGGDSVRLLESGVSRAQLKQGKGKALDVFVLEAGKTLSFEVPGGGKLSVGIYQILPATGTVAAATFEVKVDSKKAQQIAGTTTPAKDTTVLGGGPGMTVGAGKPAVAKLGSGKHTVRISAPAGSTGAVIRFEFVAKGSRKPALITEPAAAPPPSSSLSSVAMALDDDDDVAAPPTPPPEPTPPPPEPQPVSPPPTPETPATPPPVEESPEQRLLKRIAAGELRDGLLAEFPEALIAHEGEATPIPFHVVAAEASYSIAVGGPGVLTIRLHRLIDPALAQAAAGTAYSVILFEDDVLLQRLNGTTEVSKTWRMEKPPLLSGERLLSEPKEYRLTVGPKQARIAVQIAQAAEGMSIRYTFAPEKASLAAMALDLGDDEEGGGAPIAVAPTVVMEVDVSERVAVEVREGFLAVLVTGGTVVPTVGTTPGWHGTLELGVVLPFAGRMLSLGAAGGFERSTLKVNVGDPEGVAYPAAATVYAVPLLGKLTARIPFGESGVGMFVDAGGGVCMTRASSRVLEADTVSTKWSAAAAASAGIEIDVGIGWLGLAGGYLFVPPSRYGGVLRRYSPGGANVVVTLRLGL